MIDAILALAMRRRAAELARQMADSGNLFIGLDYADAIFDLPVPGFNAEDAAMQIAHNDDFIIALMEYSEGFGVEDVTEPRHKAARAAINALMGNLE